MNRPGSTVAAATGWISWYIVGGSNRAVISMDPQSPCSRRREVCDGRSLAKYGDVIGGPPSIRRPIRVRRAALDTHASPHQVDAA
jgi:hypothetical protein